MKCTEVSHVFGMLISGTFDLIKESHYDTPVIFDFTNFVIAAILRNIKLSHFEKYVYFFMRGNELRNCKIFPQNFENLQINVSPKEI